MHRKLDLRRKRDRQDLARAMDLRRPRDHKDFWTNVRRHGLSAAIDIREKELGR